MKINDFADMAKTNPIKPNWTAEHFTEKSM